MCPSPDSFWDSSAFETDTDLPAGWMRVRDTSGTYYWHIPTGTTQWEPPSPLGKVGDSMLSSTMSLETTPCEEPEVRCPRKSKAILCFPFIFYFFAHLNGKCPFSGHLGSVFQHR